MTTHISAHGRFSLHSIWDRLVHWGMTASGITPNGGKPRQVLPGVPRDCVLVLDASPSMLGTDWPPSRLAAAKASAKAFAEALAANDPAARIGIVSYARTGKRMLGLTMATQLHAVNCAIDRIGTGSWTNITAGLREAQALLKSSRRACQVVLLSDGYHNTGPDPRRTASQLKPGVTIECVGIGGSPAEVDEALMKDIASFYPDGTKRYRWIGDRATLVQHFRDLGGGLTRE